MDTLIPAVEAYKTAINHGKSFIEAPEKMKIAAEKCDNLGRKGVYREVHYLL
jgi:hypothetical protein